jgi:WD40 repeat protein
MINLKYILTMKMLLLTLTILLTTCLTKELTFLGDMDVQTGSATLKVELDGKAIKVVGIRESKDTYTNTYSYEDLKSQDKFDLFDDIADFYSFLANSFNQKDIFIQEDNSKLIVGLPLKIEIKMTQKIKQISWVGLTLNKNEDKKFKLLTTLTGHTRLYSVIELRNGNLASASEDNTIKIWDLNTSQAIQTLTGHTGYAFSITELRNGNLVSASDDGTIKIWG